MKGRKLLLLPAMLLATSGLSSCSMLCTVTWLDWDDTVLELDEHVFPFEFYRYDGKTPTRKQDAQYTYEFAGWEPVKASVSMPKRVIKRDTVYRATYTSTIRSYTITFKDASGVTLNSQVLNYGEYPQFRPEDYSTASYDYEFLGWDKPLSMVTGDEVYTANFKSTLRSYNVTWLNYDGTELAITSVAYGSYPYFDGEDPIKEVQEDEEDEYRWDFVGWQKEGYDYVGLSPVFGETTYVAQFEKHDSYEVTWLDYAGNVIKKETFAYKTTPEFSDEEPTRPVEEGYEDEYRYDFVGWKNLTTGQIGLSVETDDVTYQAQYNKHDSYVVTWLDYAGNVIGTDIVSYNSAPEFTGEDPIKPVEEGYEDEYRYDFVGWKNLNTEEMGLTADTDDVTYQAQYEKYIYEYFDMYYYIYFETSWYGLTGFVDYYDFADYSGFDDVEFSVREHTDLQLPSLISGFDVSWYLDPEFKKPVTEALDVYDSMAFYGYIEGEHQFEITYDLNGGQLAPGATNPNIVSYWDDEVMLCEPSKDGYDFIGWFDEDGYEVPSLYEVYSDTLLTAEYEAHEWTISFDCTDCEEQFDPIENVKFDSEFELPEASKVGYEFLGWKEANGTEFFTSPMKADYDVELFPEFKPIDFTITYQLAEDEACETEGFTTFNIETLDVVLPTPEKEGYNFSGWKIVSPEVEADPFISLSELPELILEDITLKPVWEAIDIKVNFDLNGGTKVFTISFMDGEELLHQETAAYGVNEVAYYVPEDKPGYQFAGWKNWPEEPITNSYVLQAKWNTILTTQTNNEFTTLKVGEQKDLSLHNLNGEYCQFTPLVDQRIRISSSGELDLLMNSSVYNTVEGISSDELNYWMEFNVKAGKTYLIRVFGATNTDGITTVKLERVDGEEIVPTGKIAAVFDDQLEPLESNYDAQLPELITPVRNGYQFEGWYCDNKKYESGDLIKETQDFTLVAHWSQLTE